MWKEILIAVCIMIPIIFIGYKIIEYYNKYIMVKDALIVAGQNNIFCEKYKPPCDIVLQDNLSVPVDIVAEPFDKHVALFCVDLISRIIALYLPPKLDSFSVHPGLTLIKELVYPDGEFPIMGYVAKDKMYGNVWIAFRGSLDKADIREDIIYKQTDLISPFTHDDSIKCHTGFTNVYKTFRRDMVDAVKSVGANKIIITGHSLGAGLATIASYEFGLRGYDVYTYTFASPRVGNIAFARAVYMNSKCFYRIVNISDLVPTLPIAVMPNMRDKNNPFIYKHVGDGQVIEFDQNWKSIENNHMIYNYRHFLKGLM